MEFQDLHGISLEEALEKARQSVAWCLRQGVDVLVLNHGKGYHSSRSFSVIKKEVRKMLKEDPNLKKAGYQIVYGESSLPVALTFDEGHTLIVAKGKENVYIGGTAQQEKHQQIFGDEARKKRKTEKKIRSEKHNRGKNLR